MRAASLTLAALLTTTVAAPAVAQSETPHRLSVGETNTKVLVQRGQDFLPSVRDMTLESRDKIVVLDGGDVTVFCDGEQAGRYNETGIYPAPECGPVAVAATEPAPAGATGTTTATTPAIPTEVIQTGTNWGSVAAIGGGLMLVAIASSVDTGNKPPPVSP